MKKTINEKIETKPAVKEQRGKRYEEAFKKQAVEPSEANRSAAEIAEGKSPAAGSPQGEAKPRQNWLQSGKPGTQIARELGVSYPTLEQWKRCYWGDAVPVRPDLERENHALRAELAEQIAAVHREHRGRYGAPRIQRELSARGRRHSRKRIARLMCERGLNAC